MMSVLLWVMRPTRSTPLTLPQAFAVAVSVIAFRSVIAVIMLVSFFGSVVSSKSGIGSRVVSGFDDVEEECGFLRLTAGNKCAGDCVGDVIVCAWWMVDRVFSAACCSPFKTTQLRGQFRMVEQ